MTDLFNLKSPSDVTKGINIDDAGTRIFIGVDKVQTVGGTWTPTRIADNNVVLRKTAAADTSYIYASLRPLIKAAANRGARVTSIDVIYSVGTAALTSHTPTLSNVVYANNVAVAVSAHGGTISGTLATATQANPYVSTLTLGTKTFEVSSLGDVRLQIAVVAGGTTAYDFYGLVVNLDVNAV